MTPQKIQQRASDEKTDDSKEETNENEILGEVKSVEDGKMPLQ